MATATICLSPDSSVVIQVLDVLFIFASLQRQADLTVSFAHHSLFPCYTSPTKLLLVVVGGTDLDFHASSYISMLWSSALWSFQWHHLVEQNTR